GSLATHEVSFMYKVSFMSNGGKRQRPLKLNCAMFYSYPEDRESAKPSRRDCVTVTKPRARQLLFNYPHAIMSGSFQTGWQPIFQIENGLEYFCVDCVAYIQNSAPRCATAIRRRTSTSSTSP